MRGTLIRKRSWVTFAKQGQNYEVGWYAVVGLGGGQILSKEVVRSDFWKSKDVHGYTCEIDGSRAQVSRHSFEASFICPVWAFRRHNSLRKDQAHDHGRNPRSLAVMKLEQASACKYHLDWIQWHTKSTKSCGIHVQVFIGWICRKEEDCCMAITLTMQSFLHSMRKPEGWSRSNPIEY